MPPTAISAIFINKLLACVLRVEHLKKWALVLLLPAFNLASWVFAVHSERSVFDIPCIEAENCSVISGEKMCDSILGMCSCAEGFVRMNNYNHCVPYVGMGQHCQDNEQCRHSGPNVLCGKWSQRCECIYGYEERETNGKKMCFKAPQVVYEPYIVHVFSSLGPVHIILGALTGSLALLACFAGIIQLVRKKYVSARCNGVHTSQFSPDFGYSTTSAPSQSHPFSDSQFTSTLPSGGDFACLEGNSTAPPTPGTLGDEEYVVTPPPTYEEAVQSDKERAKAPSVMTV